MPSDPPRSPSEALQPVWIAGAFLLATVVRAAFVVSFPTIHGGDAAARIAGASELVLGYQLPLPQLFVAIGKGVWDDPIGVRLIFSVWGGVLASGLAALVAWGCGPREGVFAGFLVAIDPLLVHYSIVPYQESVAYGLLAWAFAVSGSGRPVAGGLLMAGACLSRFECWLFLPVFFLVSRSKPGVAIASAPVLGWLAWWKGLAPAGLYVVDLDPEAGRLSRVAFLGRKFLEYESGALGLLAAAGLLIALHQRDPRWLKALLTLGFVITVVISFGHEYPPGSGLMSERLIHLPVLVTLALAATALERISGLSRGALVFCLGAMLFLAGRNLRFETLLLRAAAMEPNLALARDIAHAVEAERRPGECVSVVAPAVDPKLLADYIRKVGTSFGDVVSARERARVLSTSSPDLDRIAAHLPAESGTVRAAPGCPVVAFVDNFEGIDTTFTLVAEISAGPRRARVYRTPR